ncbi:Short-chain dehydrogenase/reductase [Exophiala dermatitidis]
MASLKALGIETLPLDVVSEDSIKACVHEVSALTGGSLDMLINNAGAAYFMLILDTPIHKLENLFDLNTYFIVRTAQHFLLLLRNSQHGGHLVNNTSLAASWALPWHGPYSASKAAASSITSSLRYELEPFGIDVTELKTGVVQSNVSANLAAADKGSVLPDSSVYALIKDKIGAVMRGDHGFTPQPTDQWARAVVNDLSRCNPPKEIWRGATASIFWATVTFLPRMVVDFILKRSAGVHVIAQRLREQEESQKRKWHARV